VDVDTDPEGATPASSVAGDLESDADPSILTTDIIEQEELERQRRQKFEEDRARQRAKEFRFVVASLCEIFFLDQVLSFANSAFLCDLFFFFFFFCTESNVILTRSKLRRSANLTS
jgi:hypothetical protein